MPTLKVVRLDIERYKLILARIEGHIACNRLNDAREAVREAKALKLRIEQRMTIENWLRDAYNRAVH